MTLLDRLYHRHGLRYLQALFGFGVLACYGGLAITMVVLTRYMADSLDDTPQFVLFAFAAIAPAFSWMMWGIWRDFAPVRRWIEGDRGEYGALEAWQSVTQTFPKWLVRSYVAVGGSGFSISLYAGHLYDLNPTGVLLAWFGGILGLIATGAYAYCGGEIILRPLARDTARFANPEPSGTGWSMRRRMESAVIGTTAFVALVTGAIVGVQDGGEDRLAIGVGVSVAVSLTVGLLLTRAVTDAMLPPVEDLRDATERVTAGDLTSAVPVLSEDELGVLTARFNTMVEGLRERERLQAENTQLGGALRESAEDLRASRARLVAASDDARRAVERDLHDGAQQHLSLMRLKLGLLRRRLDPGSESLALVSELEEDLREALEALRELARGIYPAVLEADGIPGALADAIRRTCPDAVLHHDEIGRYHRDVEAAVYFCCLEALQNASKHGGAQATIEIELREDDGRLTLLVSDDGRGFDVGSEGIGAGLQNMRDRLGALGGDIEITSSPGRGTQIAGRVPVVDASPIALVPRAADA